MELPPLAWSVSVSDDRLYILDETKLPEEKAYIAVADYLEAARAIAEMKTRAFGQVLTLFYTFLLTVRHNRGEDPDVILPRLRKVAWTLEQARPTFGFKDLNRKVLQWAETAQDEGKDIPSFLEEHILAFLDTLKSMRLQRADYASSLIADGDVLLTHCNVSGEMVLIGRRCREEGKTIQFFATETRPYFQGKLTSWELAEDGCDVTIVPDNAVGTLLAEGYCQKVIVGSDRVAINGDVVNKVGTFQVAVAAKKFQIPFYVLVQEPGSTATGEDIPIEERNMQEVLSYKGRRLYPKTVVGYYPAFDLTPASYITRLITFGGIIDPHELPQAWEKAQGAMRG